MTKNLKRDEVKYLRDGIKANYKKTDRCYICSDSDNLEYHHYTPLVYLWDTYKKENKIHINNTDDIMNIRYDFYDRYKTELIDDCITLCKAHHSKLHSIYGKTYSGANYITKKVRRWVEIMKNKAEVSLAASR